MSDQPNDLQLPDPADVDWDAELENLPRHEILIDIAYRRARGLVDQWFMLRAGDAIGFDDMPPELRLRPDELIGVIVVDQFAEAACRAVGVEYHELDDALYTVTSSTFIGEVYAMAGLVNAADPADSDGSFWGYPRLSAEYLLDADPDIIFLADTKCCAQTAAAIAERPGWETLTAVSTGRIVELDDDVASRWGPRIVDFLRAIVDAVNSVD